MADLPEWERTHLLHLRDEAQRFTTQPWVGGPPLRARRVALISTAGLHPRGDRPFSGGAGATEYRVIPATVAAGDLVMSHISVNFDRTGFRQDLNVVFPLDRLQELAAQSVIGSMADYHYSFMGAPWPSTRFEPKARELAGLLKKDRVDAAVLVPVWPNCTCAVGAVGHYLEEEGVSTTQISLVREHTEVIQPPRALWVPFMMGRPFGAPNAPEFQRRVLISVLRLLEASAGPVLSDFDEEAPGSVSNEETEGAACPVNFSRPRVARDGEHALAQALSEEIAQLRPWHDLALRRRGGSTSGLSGLTPEVAGALVISFLGTGPVENYRPEQPLGLSLKHACDDLRAFYEEAATAQPGNLTAEALEDWFYFETNAGEVLRELQRVCLRSEDKGVRLFAELTLIPRSVAHKAKARGK